MAQPKFFIEKKHLSCFLRAGLKSSQVHYQIAVLHGEGELPRTQAADPDASLAPGTFVGPDLVSCLFHLCHAASLGSVRACLTLGRVLAGMPTSFSKALNKVVPMDLKAAKVLFRRAMESKNLLPEAKCAAGCLLVKILTNEETKFETVNDDELAAIIREVLRLYDLCDSEDKCALEIDDDESFCFPKFDLKAHLAEIMYNSGDITGAACMMRNAAHDAIHSGQTATGFIWRTKALEWAKESFVPGSEYWGML